MSTRTLSVPSSTPKLYATEKQKDPLVQQAFIHPRSGWQWFVTE